MKTIQSEINRACDSTKPFSKARSKALADVKWRLRCGLLYAGLNESLDVVLVERGAAQIFDGRDDQDLKQRFYRAASGYKFEVELA